MQRPAQTGFSGPQLPILHRDLLCLVKPGSNVQSGVLRRVTLDRCHMQGILSRVEKQCWNKESHWLSRCPPKGAHACRSLGLKGRPNALLCSCIGTWDKEEKVHASYRFLCIFKRFLPRTFCSLKILKILNIIWGRKRFCSTLLGSFSSSNN